MNLKGTLTPNPIPVIIYNQPLIGVPDSEEKLCWEKECCLLKLLAAVISMTVSMGSYSTKMMAKFQDDCLV